MFKEQIALALAKHLQVKKGEILAQLEKPRYSNLGDLAFPCFSLAKQQKKNPFEIASELAEKIYPIKGVEKIQPLGGYVNFFVNKKVLGKEIITKILHEKNRFGSTKEGKGKKVVVEFSSPNIAKPMSIGHLRSTVIGNSLMKIFSFLGYKCISINYLGDYGTQFGALLVAYKRWGAEVEKEMQKNPISALLKLYTRFSSEVEKNPELEEAARAEFRKLESKDKETIKLWKTFRDFSIQEFKRFYKTFSIDFDVYSGESFYSEQAKKIIQEMIDKKVATKSAGALIVQLKESPLLVQKSDGSTLYSTRDLAAAKDRYEKYRFDRMIYVVGSEQNLYFRQLFKTLELLGYEWAKNCVHANFGMIYLPSGKISTRKGTLVFVEEVLEKIFELTRKFVAKENLSEKEKEKISKAVGISALIYSDLSNDRIKDICFDWNNILRLEGDSGPYIQYTYARAKSILRKSEKSEKFHVPSLPLTEEEKSLVIDLSEFPYMVKDAADHFSPHIIANYMLKLSDNFNSFYERCPVMRAEKATRQSRIALTTAAAQIIHNCMVLLGMIPLEKM